MISLGHGSWPLTFSLQDRPFVPSSKLGDTLVPATGTEHLLCARAWFGHSPGLARGNLTLTPTP